MWTHRNASLQDYRAVKANVAFRLKEEHDEAKSMFGTDVAASLKAAIKTGNAYSILRDGMPSAIIAWEINDGEINTGFLATELYFDISPSALRFSRKLVHEIQVKSGNRPISSNSLGKHGKLARWYVALGFVERVVSTEYRNFYLAPRPNWEGQ